MIPTPPYEYCAAYQTLPAAMGHDDDDRCVCKKKCILAWKTCTVCIPKTAPNWCKPSQKAFV